MRRGGRALKVNGQLNIAKTKEEPVSVPQLLEDYRVVVFSDEDLAALKKALEETFFSGAYALLYFVGKGCGERSYRRLSQLYSDRQALVDACISLKERERWGSFRCEIVEDGTGTIRVENCFEARGCGNSKEPACYFLKGYLEGFLSNVFQRQLKVTETSCFAKGDRECVFESRPGQRVAGET